MSQVRVATHVHSDWSYDASWTLARIATAFSRRGYDAILMAEHDRGFDEDRWQTYRNACASASTPEIRLIPGIEYSDSSNAVHVPVWGDIPFLGEALDTTELLKRVEDTGGLGVLAHPRRHAVFDRIDPEWLPRLVGIELWNRRYDGYAPNHDVAELLADHPDLLPVSSLDFHTARHFHPLAMVFSLDQEVSELAVTLALRQRRARPTAFRLPAESFAEGAAWPAMRELDRARRFGVTGARRLRGSIRRARAPGRT
jgi:hypothetical protein